MEALNHGRRSTHFLAAIAGRDGGQGRPVLPPPVDLADARAQRDARATWAPVLDAMDVSLFVAAYEPETLKRTGGQRTTVWCPPRVAAKGRGGIIDICSSLPPRERDAAIADALGTIARLRAEHRAGEPT